MRPQLQQQSFPRTILFSSWHPLVGCKSRRKMLSSHWLGRHFVTGGKFNASAAKIGVLVRVHRKMSSLVDSSTLSDPGFVSLAPSQDQVHRIVASKTFQSAPTLQQLFRFLATRALE